MQCTAGSRDSRFGYIQTPAHQTFGGPLGEVREICDAVAIILHVYETRDHFPILRTRILCDRISYIRILMGLVKPSNTTFAKIKVIGIGGGGGNALNSMITGNLIQGVEFVAINTDAQSLLTNKADTKFQIGTNYTRGLGSGADPEVGRQAAEESREKLKRTCV